MVGRHSPQHARRTRPSGAEELSTSDDRLRTLGTRLPGLGVGSTSSLGRARVGGGVGRLALVLVVFAVVVAAGVQWFRPLPSPTLHTAVSTVLRIPGTAPALPWPSGAPAALAVSDGPLIGSSGPETPVPIAGLAKMMTAYVVVKDHPLATGSDGPAIAVTPDALAAFQAQSTNGESVVPLASGESLSELQVLQGLVVASGNDMATLLADFDAGGTKGFVAKMNSTAHALGMRSTTFTDPVGLDPGTVSTPRDLLHLADAVLGVPALRQMVAMTEVTLPLAGRVFNLNSNLGRGGFIGLKTGSDTAAGGCFLFAAQRPVAGTNVTLVGAIVGVHGPTPTNSALSDAAALVDAAFATSGPQPAVGRDSVLGDVAAPWT
ncbi:MAG TPA: hypothetical protein VKR22_11735, partial [Acidimicrobiales bacterium]|nr:hypothetical protein [Acidimicrobiales bacterium]